MIWSNYFNKPSILASGNTFLLYWCAQIKAHTLNILTPCVSSSQSNFIKFVATIHHRLSATLEMAEALKFLSSFIMCACACVCGWKWMWVSAGMCDSHHKILFSFKDGEQCRYISKLWLIWDMRLIWSLTLNPADHFSFLRCDRPDAVLVRGKTGKNNPSKLLSAFF